MSEKQPEQFQALHQELRRIAEMLEAQQTVPAALKQEQARRYLGVPSQAFRQLVRSGAIKSFVAPGSKRRLFRRADLDAALHRLLNSTDQTTDMDFGED